ncbi:gluconokinase [Herbiconiux sp. 11R-BC]|uniref:gluconokinase n=1 Tax=Herbiconiux sp. 11R-BC TaxID=3111637 RepID=UPI003C0B5E1A
MNGPPLRIVVGGVSGAGKSTVGRALAARLGAGFVDADELHSAAAVATMASGVPLTDLDRWPWLDRVAAVLRDAPPEGVVVACSALRRIYRDRIRLIAPDAAFVQLTGSRELLTERITARTAHYMPASLLESQLALVEPLGDDEKGAALDVALPPGALVDDVVRLLRPRCAKLGD